MKKLMFTFLMLITFAGANVSAQEKEDYKNDPGYLDLSDMSKFMQGERVTDIELESNMLKMLSKLGGDEKPEFRQLVANLKLIRVNSFGVDESNKNAVMEKINSIDKQLTGRKWERIFKMKNKGENTNIYVLPSGDYENVLGLVVASVDSKRGNGREATFVNIVGKINMEQLGKLGTKFHIPNIGDMKKDKDSKEWKKKKDEKALKDEKPRK